MNNVTVEFNRNVRNYWIRNWAYNAFENYEYIKREFEEGKAQCMSTLPRADGVPAIIVGSGVSLDEALPFLRFWRGALFASPSHAKILDHWGIRPTYIMAVDTSEDVAEKLNGPNYIDTALLTHPCSDPKTIQSWKGEKYYFRMNELEGEFIPNVLPTVYPWIKANILNSGCFVNTAIVTAAGMGFGPIFLVGANFSFPEDEKGVRDRFREVERKAKYVYSWKEDRGYTKGYRYIDTSGDQFCKEHDLWTTTTNLFYKRALMGIYKHYLPPLINCSEGILKELPHASIEEVIKAQGQGYEEKLHTTEQIDKIVDDYLIPRGQYAVRKEGGLLGMETADGIEDQIKATEDRLQKLRHVNKLWKFKNGKWERKEG